MDNNNIYIYCVMKVCMNTEEIKQQSYFGGADRGERTRNHWEPQIRVRIFIDFLIEYYRFFYYVFTFEPCVWINYSKT